MGSVRPVGDPPDDGGLAALLDHLPELVILVEPYGNMCWVNQSLCDALGYRRDELLGTSCFDFVHPDDLEYALGSMVNRLAEDGPGQTVEIRARASDGGYRLFEVIGLDLRHVEGVDAVVATFRDVTNRAAMADSPARLRSLVENSSDITLLVDGNGRVEFCNHTLTRLLGRDPDLLVGAAASDLFHPADIAEARDRFQRMITTGERHMSWRARLAHVDGTDRLFDLRAVGHLDDPVIRGLVVTARDITELRDAQERFRRIFLSAPIGMALLDTTGCVSEVNPALRALLASTEAELLSRPLSELVLSEDRELYERRLADAVGGGAGSFTLELRLVRADRHIVWTALSASVRPDPMSDGSDVIVQIEDIQARKHIEEMLREQNARLQIEVERDPLTGLANRSALMRHLEDALATPGDPEVWVLFCDLDGFKQINDDHGHEVGDRVLIEVADRMGEVVRSGDVVGRFGGDEFVVVCTGLVGATQARELAERLDRHVRRPIPVGPLELAVGLSVGAAEGRPGSDAADTVVARADGAMYRVKTERGRAPGVTRNERPSSG
jgi:diguanylate cyclase (GGDEF)-like protein/PAS domain S-box-containing protein